MTVSTTSRSVSVSWDAIECMEQNGVITGYEVKFQKEEGGTDEELSTNVFENFTVDGLTPSTSYTFQVAGVNINGTGPFTNMLVITTNEDGKYKL